MIYLFVASACKVSLVVTQSFKHSNFNIVLVANSNPSFTEVGIFSFIVTNKVWQLNAGKLPFLSNKGAVYRYIVFDFELSVLIVYDPSVLDV